VVRRFRVADGTCLDCAGDIGGVLGGVAGVHSARVSEAIRLVEVTHDGSVTDDAVRRAASGLGLDLTPAEPGRVRETGRAWWRRPNLVLLLIAVVMLLAALIAERLPPAQGLATGLYLAAVLVGGIYPVRTAIGVLRRRRVTIGTLLVIATGGALALGIFEEAALLVVVFSLGEVLEDWVTDRARGSIRALMALSPPTAHRLHIDGSTAEVAVETLVPADVVLVRPGERIPTDGTVLSGSSAVDASPITGESIPIEATAGTVVFGGSVNGNGALRVEVAKPYAETVLARVIREVEQAQTRRGRAQRFADRFGAIYTPLMVAAAVLMAAAGPLFGLDWRSSLYRGLVVLTVSCSCALVISVPVAVVAGIARAARDGILIKGGTHLEALARLKVLAFDKTGTLTTGRPHLTGIATTPGYTEHGVLQVAATVEAGSEHPLASAITTAARQRGITFTAASDTQAILGVGVQASLPGGRLGFVGRTDHRLRLAGTLADQAAKLEGEGHTVVAVTAGDQLLGLLAVADQLRPEAAHTIHALRALGIADIVMLTGDHQRTAAAIATAAGITTWHAGLLPSTKAEAVQQLHHSHGPVGMVGDGVNDAPALATAEVGIAMGAAGTDVALETADIALMADDLTRLPTAVRLAHRTMTIIRQNVALSLVTVAALVTAAAAGKLSLSSGLLLNEGTALLIIANGLRLLRADKQTLGQPR
jgi:Cd2+/Zn2+-exporting ATPase